MVDRKLKKTPMYHLLKSSFALCYILHTSNETFVCFSHKTKMKIILIIWKVMWSEWNSMKENEYQQYIFIYKDFYMCLRVFACSYVIAKGKIPGIYFFSFCKIKRDVCQNDLNCLLKTKTRSETYNRKRQIFKNFSTLTRLIIPHKYRDNSLIRLYSQFSWYTGGC